MNQAEFQSLLRGLGSLATDRQLERWRNEGLLPKAVQIPACGPDGRPAGSTVEHLRSSARQAIAIERTLAEAHAFSRAGPVLWTAGFEVDERYWRPGLQRTDELFALAIGAIQSVSDTEDSDDTLGDELARAVRTSGLIHKAARKIGRAELPRLFNLCASIAAGDFREFAPQAADEDLPDEQFAARALGVHQGAAHHIGEIGLRLVTDLAAILAGLSRSLSGYRLADFSNDEVAAARDDVRNALKVGYCLFQATSWIYGPKAFGLQIAGALPRFASQELLSALTVGFVRLRRVSEDLLTSDEIADLAAKAEKVWLMSMSLRDTYEGGDGAGIVNPERLKSALTDSVSYQNLLRELASHEFAKREFRPWDQWRKSAGKTMSPGLLAMSIGAPGTIAFDDLVGSMSAPAIP